MIATDRPNTLFTTPGNERYRLFYPFRYKQDNVNPWDGREVLLHSFQDYRDSTFDFQRTLNDYPYMR